MGTPPQTGSPAGPQTRPLPTPCVIVLIGPPASGKSTWAGENARPDQVLSSDDLRGVVGEHPLDLAATDDAFELVDRMLEMRCARKLTTVVDTTGLDAGRRAKAIEVARTNGLNTVAVRFTTTAAECKRRNRERTHPVPVKVIDAMAKTAKALDLSDEDWDLVMEPTPVRLVTPKLAPVVDHDLALEEGAAASPVPAPLRFGLHLSSFDWPGDAAAIGPTLTRIARDAEAAGFDSLWVMDHMIQIPQLGSAWDPMLESYSTLSFLAGATERLRLGVLVSAVTFRTIGHLAKTIATLDVLSGGRAIAGLGAANSEHEHHAYGQPFPPVASRLAMLEDALRALPLFWGPGAPSFEGRTISIPETVGYPRPIQDRIPMIVGGSGEQVTLRLAAELADGCNLFGDITTVRRKVEVLHRHCADVGRHPSDVEITHLSTSLVAGDSAELNRRVESLRPSRQGPDRYAASVNAGTVDDHEARLRQLVDAGVGTVMISVPDVFEPAAMEPMAELIARFSP